MIKMVVAYEKLGNTVKKYIDVIYNKAGAVDNKIITLDDVDEYLQQIREALQWERNATQHKGEEEGV